MHCRVLSSIPGLYLLDASGSPGPEKKCLQMFPWLRATGLRDIQTLIQPNSDFLEEVGLGFVLKG